MPKVCTAPDCDRPAVAKGLCDAHDHRRRRGDPALDTPLRRYGVKGCSVEGCTSPHAARGYCYRHWKQHRYGPTQRRQRTPDEIAAMRALYASGVNMTEIARRFDCSRATVVRIIRGETFRTTAEAFDESL